MASWKKRVNCSQCQLGVFSTPVTSHSSDACLCIQTKPQFAYIWRCQYVLLNTPANGFLNRHPAKLAFQKLLLILVDAFIPRNTTKDMISFISSAVSCVSVRHFGVLWHRIAAAKRMTGPSTSLPSWAELKGRTVALNLWIALRSKPIVAKWPVTNVPWKSPSLHHFYFHFGSDDFWWLLDVTSPLFVPTTRVDRGTEHTLFWLWPSTPAAVRQAGCSPVLSVEIHPETTR